MKVRVLAVLVAFAVLTSTSVASPRYYINTGISKAMAPVEFKDNWRSGFNLGAGIGTALTQRLELVGELELHQMQLNDTAFLRSVTKSEDVYSSVSGGSASILGLAANLKYSVPSANKPQVTPYLKASLGIDTKIVSEKEITTVDKSYSEPKESVVRPSVGLGIGFEIVMAKTTSLVFEVGAQTLFTKEPTVYFPLKFGIALN